MAGYLLVERNRNNQQKEIAGKVKKARKRAHRASQTAEENKRNEED